MDQWFDNEEFWQDLFPFLFSEDKFAAAEQEVEALIRLSDFRGRTVLDLACGPGRHSIIEDWNRVRGEWILLKGQEAKRFGLTLRLYSGQELKDALHAAGFAKVKLYGDLNGTAYGIEATRLVAVCWR